MSQKVAEKKRSASLWKTAARLEQLKLRKKAQVLVMQSHPARNRRSRGLARLDAGCKVAATDYQFDI
eukprot:s282_g23.t1